MLGQLHVKNIGIIDDIVINFDDGLNILTGETGAGKSLIIDSISAICGSRLSKDLIKYGENEALIEACFFGDEDTILTREIYKNGRSICKVNGKMVSLSDFKAIGESLIDIHGQHDNQSLLDAKTHINLLDKFAGDEINSFISEYQELLANYKDIKKQISDNYADPIERARRLDLLKYQNDEIQNSNLKNDEEETLSAKRSLIMNSEKISKGLNSAYLEVSEASMNSLENAIHDIKPLSLLDKKYENLLNSLNEAYFLVKDVSYDIKSDIDDTCFDENEQKEIEERLDLIYSLKRKYGSDIKSILEYNYKIEEEINRIENSEDIAKELNEKLDKINSKLIDVADKIRNVRIKTASVIESKINKELNDLEMKNAYIKFDFKNSDTFLNNGMDDVQIMICTNVGEGLKPLSKIASGGEISRVMLAIKTVLCKFDNIPTMIFDEIDTGISGQAGVSVAEKMKRIGKTHQVIVVTHLPQIAACGDANFYIKKFVKKERTSTTVKKLNEEETVNEIARILAGNDITNTVVKHAKEMRLQAK